MADKKAARRHLERVLNGAGNRIRASCYEMTREIMDREIEPKSAMIVVCCVALGDHSLTHVVPMGVPAFLDQFLPVANTTDERALALLNATCAQGAQTVGVALITHCAVKYTNLDGTPSDVRIEGGKTRWGITSPDAKRYLFEFSRARVV
jgi:hypothetical protein